MKTLTRRELTIASLATVGMSNKQIARQLYVFQRTIECHLGSIYKKLNIPNRTALVYYFYQNKSLVDEWIQKYHSIINTRSSKFYKLNKGRCHKFRVLIRLSSLKERIKLKNISDNELMIEIQRIFDLVQDYNY